VIGEPGSREWLLYANSPLTDRTGVTITIPGYGDVTVDVAVEGSFYLVDEARGKVWFVPEAGDFEPNGVVGLGDFSLFGGMYATGAADPDWNPIYDLDGNGFVGLGDFSLFAGLYGTTYADDGYVGAGPVPEPAALVLTAWGALALMRRRRNRAARRAEGGGFRC
jgi:hypothetical protein